MHDPLFPVATPVMFLWLACLILLGVLFVHGMNMLLRRARRGAVAGIFVLLLAAGTAVHLAVLSLSAHTVTQGNWIQLGLMSLVAALQMFVGHTVVFDDIIAAVIFHSPGLMLTYLTVFALILLFTFVIVFQVLPRRFRDRMWLVRHRYGAMLDRKNHVFLGISPEAKALAKSILAEWEAEGSGKDQGRLIFVDYPAQEGPGGEVSLSRIFASLASRRRELSLDEELGSASFILLKGRRPGEGNGKDLAEAVGLEGLRPWLENPRTSLYLLAGAEENRSALEKLVDAPCQAKVFCLSDEKDSLDMMYATLVGRIRQVDSDSLAVQHLKYHQPDLHPVRFVDIARDAEGQPAGYVDSGFHAMVIGFGRPGEEAFRFLYEFGAFIGKDRRQVPTSFRICDPRVDALKGAFLTRNPGLRDDPSIQWTPAGADSDAFWRQYEADLPELNYVMVNVGDDRKNVSIAIRLLRKAAQGKKDFSRFAILVRLRHPDDRITRLIAFNNRTYGGEIPVIHAYGSFGDVWRTDVLTGKDFKDRASLFYLSSQEAQGRNEDWEGRKKRLQDPDGDHLRNSMALMRQQGQDLSCCAHIPTKIALSSRAAREAASRIPVAVSEGSALAFPAGEAAFDCLEYLVAGEQLRWTSSHKVSGYTCGPEDELLQTVPDLVAYDEMKDKGSVRDRWMAVKTSLCMDAEPETDTIQHGKEEI